MFVYTLRTAPFLRLVIPLILGILLQYQLSISLSCLLYSFPVLLGFWVIIQYLPIWIRYTADWARGVILQLLVLVMGCCLVDPHPPLIALQGGDLLEGVVSTPLYHRSTVLEDVYIIRRKQRVRCKGKILVYFPVVKGIEEGDRILCYGSLQPIYYSGNPGAFDYRQYCADRHIYQQVRLKEGCWRRFPGKKSWLGKCRDYCIHTINDLIGGKEAGLGAALLIGYRFELDREMVQDYMHTGIVHIIAISGMHLALIYGCLIWLLQWWPNNRFYNISRAIIILFLLWTFTLLTGAAASVLRATLMLTFMTIGKFLLERETSIYNLLSLSAFLMLCYDPALIKDAGFQLSYLAVLGIVICYKPLYERLTIKRYWLDKVWEATALSIAAQFITFPLCLYYFHQFPVYFLPANLLAVPLSTLILYGEIGLLLLRAHWLGAGLKWLIHAMNTAVAWMGHLPGAMIAEVYLSRCGLVAAYMMIAGLLAGKHGIWLMLTGACLWSGYHCYTQFYKPRLMIVYNIPRHTGIDLIKGKVAQYIGDDSLPTAILQAARKYYDVERGFEQAGHFICCGKKRLVIVDRALPPKRAAKKFKTDYLLLSHNPRVAIKDLERFFVTGCYIFDASCSRTRIQEWKSECYALTLRFFSVPDQGAYVVNF